MGYLSPETYNTILKTWGKWDFSGTSEYEDNLGLKYHSYGFKIQTSSLPSLQKGQGTFSLCKEAKTRWKVQLWDAHNWHKNYWILEVFYVMDSMFPPLSNETAPLYST